MQSARIIHISMLLVLFFFAANDASAKDAGENSALGSRASFAIWDTLESSNAPYLTKSVVAKSGWSPISIPDKSPAFKGDAVISNGRVLGVIRKQSSGMEVYSEGTSGPVQRLRLQLVSSTGEPADRRPHTAVRRLVRGSRDARARAPS